MNQQFDPCEIPASFVPQDMLTRWVGDDWQFPINYVTAAGAKFNLTGYLGVGATLYVRGSSSPINVGGLNGSAVINGAPTLGSILVVVNKVVTDDVLPDPSFQEAGPTRLQVWVRDPNDLRTTIAVFPIFVRLE